MLGCFNKIPSVEPFEKGPFTYTVVATERYSEVCKYKLRLAANMYVDFEETLLVIDSIGKFKVGDVVIVKMTLK